MTDGLTPQGAAAVRLAASTVQLRKERDHARDVAVALEQQLAQVQALATSWEKWDAYAQFNYGEATEGPAYAKAIRAAMEDER